MIRTLLLDLGNVICPFSHERMCDQIAIVSGLTRKSVRQFLFDDQWLSLLEHGQIGVDELHQEMEHIAKCSIDRSKFWLAFCNIFTVDIGLVKVVTQLKSQGYRTVLLSNTSIPHLEFVTKEFELTDLFDAQVLSYEVGESKPHSAIFKRALSKIQCEPGECFYTDDIETYVTEARKHGIQAEVFHDVDRFVTDLSNHGITVENHC